jgi:fructose-1,6-bisphosphatase I
MNIRRNILTLEEFRKQELRFLPQATGELSNLLRDIALAAKRVNVEVNKAGLEDILGDTGRSNIQGEGVKKLDEFANAEFIAVLRRGVSCAGIASEELDDFECFDDELCKQSKYVVVMDPLDGSSNIDVNISIGTIFGVYRRKSKTGELCQLEDFLQKGENLIAAGYIIYGSSTMLLYATRRGVNGFTLDPTIGEFTISHPDIRCPSDGKVYSVNQGNYHKYNDHVKQYIDQCQQRPKLGDAPYTLRYTGTMVADMHRNLLKGGIFLYPSTRDYPHGKLRLLYECNPFGFIMEMAGGRATDGNSSILHIQPESLHERSPFFAGSTEMMKSFSSGN